MKLTTTALATMTIIGSADLSQSAAQLLLLILDRTTHGLRCFTPDLAEALGQDKARIRQVLERLLHSKCVSVHPVAFEGKRSLDIRPTSKALALMQGIQRLRQDIDRHHHSTATSES